MQFYSTGIHQFRGSGINVSGQKLINMEELIEIKFGFRTDVILRKYPDIESIVYSPLLGILNLIMIKNIISHF